MISYGKHCMRLITFDYVLYFPLAFLGPFKTLGCYSYTNFVIHTFLDTSVYMFMFLQLEYDLCFCSVHLQDELVVLLEGLLLVVGVLLLFVQLLAHDGGNFPKLFLILSMIDLVFQLSELCQLSFICFTYMSDLFRQNGNKVYEFFLIWVSKLQSSVVTCRIASFECMPANFFVCVHEKQWGCACG